MRRATRHTAILAVLAAALAAPGLARAGYGIQPSNQTIDVTVDQSGYVDTPSTIGLLVYLDALDSDAYVWVSNTAAVGPAGTPAGDGVGSCGPSSLTAWTEPDKYVCSVSTILMKPGTTYYWWLDFRRHDDGTVYGHDAVSGPFSFTLRQTAPQTQPAQKPSSARTKASAATLPAAAAWTGARSINDTKVAAVISRTMKLMTTPRTLAVACWTDGDFESVLEAEGGSGSDRDSEVTGVWFSDQPRWLHLRGTECTWLQRLIDTKAATAKGAFGLVNALHEAQHAYGIVNEAQANCYAVQLVPYAATYLGLPWSRADYLRKLALSTVRDDAPAGYWNAGNCRDGGAWDLVRSRANLS